MSVTTAHIYVRMSQDRYGEEWGVVRQEAAARGLCAMRGWAVVEPVVVDNDLSAKDADKVRPGFEALLASEPERIVAVAQDRITRDPADVERIIRLARRRRIDIVTLSGQETNLASTDGRFGARINAAVSAQEGDRRSDRQRLQTHQARSMGIQPMGRHRAFGFNVRRYLDRDGRKRAEVTVNEREAAEIRAAIGGVLAGGSLGAVVRDWNERGVTTTEGARWTVTGVRRMLANPRLAGRTVTKVGVDYGAQPDALVVVDRETHDRYLEMLADPARVAKISAREPRYLLTGIVQCGRCGATMMSAVNSGRRLPEPIKVYRCPACSLSRRMEAVDERVVDQVLVHLEDADPSDLLRVDDLGEARAWLASLLAERDSLDRLVALGMASSALARAEVLAPDIERAQGAVEAAEGRSPLSPLVGVEDVITAWEGLSLEEQRAALRALPGVPVVMPLGRGKRIHPQHVVMRWESS